MSLEIKVDCRQEEDYGSDVRCTELEIVENQWEKLICGHVAMCRGYSLNHSYI